MGTADDSTDLRPIGLKIGNLELLDELSEHFSRSGFAVERVGDELAVTLGDAPDDAHGRREIEVQLLVWRVLHPESPVELLA